MRHPVADRDDLTLVHVTHFNALFWDAGATPTRVIEHGIVDPGPLLHGRARRAPRSSSTRRAAAARVTGTDLLPRFRAAAPIDLFGMDAPCARRARTCRRRELHDEMARRRVYLHPIRWTSLGLSLLEAMHLGMPVVVLGDDRGVRGGAARGGRDLDARRRARRARCGGSWTTPTKPAPAARSPRAHVLARYGLERFLADWDELLVLAEVAR